MNALAPRWTLIAPALLLAGCAAAPAPQPEPDLRALQQQLRELQAQLAALSSRIDCALPESVALDPEGEFTSLTIDEVALELPDNPVWNADGRSILCHVVEWRGYERFKRFTGAADKRFWLEAADRPTLQATMSTGGVTSDSGSIRYAILRLDRGALEPGVTYTLRPRNEVEGLRWVVDDSVRVTL